MILICSSFFSEVGVRLDVSHKVDNFIRDLFRVEVMKVYGLDKLNDGWFLSYSVTTNSKTVDVSAKGPSVVKKSKMYNWGIWLPYRPIVEAININDAYIKYLFQGLAQMFKHYGVNEEDVFKVEVLVRKEIINNPEYDFKEVDYRERSAQVLESNKKKETKNDNEKEELQMDFFELDKISLRAKELMKEDFFWDCVDEFTPFGSDEGSQAYEEWQEWREENPEENLKECMAWILGDQLHSYNESILSGKKIDADKEFDIFSIDATIIATALGQLIDEGVIHKEAKPYVFVAINRQLHPSICPDSKREKILRAIKKVVESA